MLLSVNVVKLIRWCLQCWTRAGHVAGSDLLALLSVPCSMLRVVLHYPALSLDLCWDPYAVLYSIIIPLCAFFSFEACEIWWAPEHSLYCEKEGMLCGHTGSARRRVGSVKTCWASDGKLLMGVWDPDLIWSCLCRYWDWSLVWIPQTTLGYCWTV